MLIVLKILALLPCNRFFRKLRFESNVILNTTKTDQQKRKYYNVFESDVILNTTKTKVSIRYILPPFDNFYSVQKTKATKKVTKFGDLNFIR